MCADAAQKIAVPAYFYPSFPDPLWEQMEDAYPTLGLAVMNPASGAGPAADPNYVSQIAATRASGVRVIGYVYSSYAARDANLLEADIDNYYTWYNVDGIFIDEASNNCADTAYYSALDTYVKGKGGLGITVINPGINTPECYASTADILLNFEGSYTAYQAFVPSAWESGYDPSKFWHLVYATAEADVAAAVLQSQAHGAGWVYVTPDTLANPWDTLPGPTYWATELAYVAPLEGSCTTPAVRSKLTLKQMETPPGDDSIVLSGRATFDADAEIDPVANGVRLFIGDEGGTIADITIAGGLYASPPDYGWKVSGGGNKWTYSDKSDVPASGITRLSISAKEDGPLTKVVSFKVKGIDGSYPVSPDELPATAALLLTPDEAEGPCARASFVAPASCVAKSESVIQCR